jgi:ribonuclease D
MKRNIAVICLLFLIVSCNHTIDKPKNLIEKDKMVNILYDLSLLEAIKAQHINGGLDNKTANKYIYEKYKIDSVQLAQSNKYYASDIEEYKKIFEQVKAKLEEESKKNGIDNPVVPAPDMPQVQ